MQDELGLNLYDYGARNYDPDGKEIIVANKKDQGAVLKMINSKAVGTFAFDKGGKLYLKSSSGDATKFSTYYRDKLIEGINTKDKVISISINNNPNEPTGVGKDKKTIEYDASKKIDVDKSAGGGITFGAEGTNADVFISGNENKNLKDTSGKALEDKPEDILMHELISHAIPIITGNDQGNAVQEENKARAEIPPGTQRAAESTKDHPLCKGCH